MIRRTGSRVAAILTSLGVCAALHVSKHGTVTDITLDHKVRSEARLDAPLSRAGLKAVDLAGMAHSDAAAVHQFFINGEPKSGTTWVEVIVEQILQVTCRGIATCSISSKKRGVVRKTADSVTNFLPLIGKHQVPLIGHGQAFNSGTPPVLSDDEILQKAAQYSQELPPQNNIFAVFRDPRSVAISACYHKVYDCPQANRDSYARDRIETLSKWIDLRHRFWSAVKSLNPDRVMLIFFEDLKASPHEQIEQMSEFLGTPMSQAEAEEVENATTMSAMKTLGTVAQGGAQTGKVRDGQTCNYNRDLSANVATMATNIMRGALSAELNAKWAC